MEYSYHLYIWLLSKTCYFERSYENSNTYLYCFLNIFYEEFQYQITETKTKQTENLVWRLPTCPVNEEFINVPIENRRFCNDIIKHQLQIFNYLRSAKLSSRLWFCSLCWESPTSSSSSTPSCFRELNTNISTCWSTPS